MPTPPKPIRRTVFDLSPQELHDLRRLNLQVSATVPPQRPRPSRSASEFAFDYSIYERYRDLHLRAKVERSEWLRARRITLKVAAHAVLTDYNPYANAARIGRVAPSMPEGYAQALAGLTESVEVRDRKAQVQTFDLPGGLKGFLF